MSSIGASLPPYQWRLPEEEKALAESAPIPWANLQDRETFSYNGRQYRICPTAGDGTCALHAVLGEEKGGVYSFLGESESGLDARSYYLQRLSERNSEQNLMLERYLMGRLAEITTEECTRTKENQMFADQLSKEFLDTVKARRESVLTADLHPSAFEEFLQEDAAKEAVLHAYWTVCMHDKYYFCDEEIGLMASLFDQQVTVFGALSTPSIYNPKGQREILIHFRPNHYSRCEIVR